MKSKEKVNVLYKEHFKKIHFTVGKNIVVYLSYLFLSLMFQLILTVSMMMSRSTAALHVTTP